MSRSPTDTAFFRGVAQTDLAIRDYQAKAPMFFAGARMMGAVFTVDATVAARLLPDERCRPVRLLSGRTLAAVVACDYDYTDLGPYKEVFVAIPIAFSRSALLNPLRFAAGLLRRKVTAHTVQLPVDNEAALFGGIDLYNVPKYMADIDLEHGGATSCCTVTDAADGKTVFKLRGAMPKPRTAPLFSPLKRQTLRNYTTMDGRGLMATIDFHLPKYAVAGPDCNVRLVAGDSSRSAMLNDLGFGKALFAFTAAQGEAILREPRRM